MIGEIRRAVPYKSLAIGLGLLVFVALAAMSAKEVVGQTLARSFSLSTADVLLMLPLLALSFGMRVLRWHVLVSRVAPRLPPILSLHSQLVGFAFSSTPGRIAELYKLRMIERDAGVPAARTLPAFLVERLTDVAAFGSLAAVGGWLSWTGLGGHGETVRWLVPVAGVGALAIGYQAYSRGWLDRVAPAVSRLGQAGLTRLGRLMSGQGGVTSVLGQLRTGMTRVATPGVVSIALTCVVLGRLGDAVIIWNVARIIGYPVPLPLAVFLIASAGLAGGISLSPGGLGAAEATLTAVTFSQGVPIDAALSIALLSRAFIFWDWVVLGLLVFAVGTGVRALSLNRLAVRVPSPTLR